MLAKHWLIGFAMCLAGVGSASASSRNTQDLDNTTHVTADSNSAHDDGGAIGDVVTSFARGTPPRVISHDSHGSVPASSDRSGGGDPTPAPARQPRLGWQSLLPGSIQ
ncbi:hypothetical protein [Rhodanobacter sp. L36]|uniref:hypothetical protein n=1 Tax=Rhodanobacter sp. L36 TaxID=1747221 RepID=UPI00131D1ECF|nr:hypothetical protein [Rhodanobacter sp. L36]